MIALKRLSMSALGWRQVKIEPDPASFLHPVEPPFFQF
jgi:hypothetical protein